MWWMVFGALLIFLLIFGWALTAIGGYTDDDDEMERFRRWRDAMERDR